jgi:hypothetical protein
MGRVLLSFFGNNAAHYHVVCMLSCPAQETRGYWSASRIGAWRAFAPRTNGATLAGCALTTNTISSLYPFGYNIFFHCGAHPMSLAAILSAKFFWHMVNHRAVAFSLLSSASAMRLV